MSRHMNQPTDLTAANLRAELARQKVSRAAVARELGVTEMWVSRRVNGQTPITVADLYAICDILQIPPSRVLPEAAAS